MPASGPSPPSEVAPPSHRFALLGSGEFLPWTDEVDRRLLAGATGDGTVLILPTASAPEGDGVFERWAAMGRNHYEALGIPARALPLRTREEADRPELADELSTASAVFFSGGNPAYLAGVLEGSEFWAALLRALDRGMAYAGCSAGVACLGDLAPDSSIRDPSVANPWRPGLRLFPGLWLAPHWDGLDRVARGLRTTIVEGVPPGVRLLTIDERTALVGDGARWTVMGAGEAGIYEGGTWSRFGPGRSFEAALSAARRLGPGQKALDLGPP